MFTSINKITQYGLLSCALTALPASAETSAQATPMQHKGHQAQLAPGGLTEAGTDMFATIQEVIARLNADPDTDWSKVDLEALRRHLRDMFEFSYNVDVLSRQPMEKGVKILVKATNPRADKALARVLKAHPMMLKMETGWTMQSRWQKDGYEITVTTSKPSEVNKIRGLGYIGILAFGSHHQAHHWVMANGRNPHQAMHRQ